MGHCCVELNTLVHSPSVGWASSHLATCYRGYLFTNNRIKILVHDGIGIWLAVRRLRQGKFIWPLSTGSDLALQRNQLDAQVLGLPWQRLADGGVITVV